VKSYFKSKTLWVNFVILVLGGVGAMFESAPIDPQIGGMILGGIAAVNMFLRSITSEAVGSGQ